MSAKVIYYPAEVLAVTKLAPQMHRITLAKPSEWVSSGLADEWVGLIIPGQFQSRYYTISTLEETVLTLDIVTHQLGLVTDWVGTAQAGEIVQISAPSGSFQNRSSWTWQTFVGDATALPALARMSMQQPEAKLVIQASAESVAAYPFLAEVTLVPDLVDWVVAWQPVDQLGYFWMSGESAQMRAIRKHFRAQSFSFASDLMGYWSASRGARK